MSKEDEKKNQTLIFRSTHEEAGSYVKISKALLRDLSISPKAKALMGVVLCLPDDWKVNAEDLSCYLNVGKNYVYSALKELTRLGYARYVKIKVGNRFSEGYYEFSEDKAFKIEEIKPEQNKNSKTIPIPKSF